MRPSISACSSNETRVCSMTPPLTNLTGTKDIMNVPTELVVTLESGYELRTKMTFTYKEDPVVLSIHPERSILRYCGTAQHRIRISSADNSDLFT